MRKTSNSNKYFFTLTFSIEKFVFVRKHIQKNLVCIVTFVFQFSRVAGSWKCSNKTPTPTQICNDLVNAVHRPKILGNRVSILTQVLIAINYYFFFDISEKYLQLRKKQKHLLRKIFGPPHTSNRIYLLRNCFPNYLYIKDMY